METKEDFNASGGELLLYELLAQLPDEYYVFHSTRWNEKLQKSEYADAHRYIQWGEADFTIFHPAYGFIVFEVKDGQIAFDRQRGWIQINRYSGHEKIIDPMEQAERSKYFFGADQTEIWRLSSTGQMLIVPPSFSVSSQTIVRWL